MGGNHARHAAPESARMKRMAVLVIAPLAVVTLVALVLLWPTQGLPGSDNAAAAAELRGEVVAIEREPCEEELPDDVNGCGTAEVEIAGGEQGGTRIETILPNGVGAPEVAVGDDVVLIETSGPDGTAYSIVDHERGVELWVVAIAFVLALVAFGRWRGITALAGLGVTFALLLLFVVPAILGGQSPLLVAIVGSAAIVLTVLYLTHGFTLSTTVAVIGTVASLVLTGLLSATVVAALHLTGITDDISSAVGSVHSVNMEGLLLAGIVIGSLGVLDDVTVTQAATVTEIARANPAYGFRTLYAAASRVGRAHIASVVNTIILAYAGSSLPLLILIIANSDSLGSVVTDQVIAQEIARSAVATLGLIAAVPITTALAAWSVRKAGAEAV